MPELSVIIPTYNRAPLVERAIRSVLAQDDPMGCEIIVVDDESQDGTIQRLNEIFSTEITQGRIQLLPGKHTGDPGAVRNRGARVARGSFLAFLDSDDGWKPGRFVVLKPLLGDLDLLLESATPAITELLGAFLKMNLGITSSAVIRQDFFLQMGGFSEGYYPLKSYLRFQGWEDYELWLKCLIHLQRKNQLKRFKLLPNDFVQLEPQASGAGRVPIRNQMFREAATLLRILPLLPGRYLPLVIWRILGAGKAIGLAL